MSNKYFPFNYEEHRQAQLSKDILAHLYSMVDSSCKSLNNKFGYSIFKNHILLVVKFSKILAQTLGANEKVCEISALLHDYAGILDYNLYEDHHIHSTKIAHELLKRLELPEEEIEQIKHCIISHRASKNIPRRTVEAEILASADAIAHILAWESLLDLAIYEYLYPEQFAREWVAKKLSRSYQKIMPQARPLIEEKYKLVRLSLEESFNQVISVIDL